MVPAQRIAREEIFGPVLSVLTFRTPEEAVEKANNTTYGLSAGVWTEKGSRILHMAARLRAGVVWANTFNRFDPSSPFGGYRESGFGREGGRHGLAGLPRGLPRCLRPPGPRRPGRRPGGSGRLAVRKTYKLYIGGAFPRSESGRSYLVADAPDGSAGQRRPGLPQGRPRRRGGGAQGPARLGRGHRLPAGPGHVPGGGDARGPPRPVRRGLVAGEGLTAEAASAAVDATVDRLVWYAGWSDKFAQVAGSSNPVAGPYFDFSVPEPTGVVGVLAPPGSSLLGLVSVVAPVITTGNAVVVIASEAQPAPGPRAGRGAGHLRPTRAAWSTSSPGARPSSPRCWPPTATSTPSTSPGPPPELETDLEVAAADNVKRVLRRQAAGPDWTADPSPARMLFFVEIKTVWHPVGV